MFLKTFSAGSFSFPAMLSHEAECLEFYPERILVHFFEKTRAESIVDLISATDDLLRQVIVLHEPLQRISGQDLHDSQDITK
jgi:hypothetical protein